MLQRICQLQTHLTYVDFLWLHFYFFLEALTLSHLALTAFRAISVLRSELKRSARILPPLEPPSLPSATALGFFFLIGLIRN
jgi:hypothetical protein